jgi:ankyrin repeat protein
MDLSELQNDDTTITQFKPVKGQWELNSVNIKRIDHYTRTTILHNYCEHINDTPIEVFRYLIETHGCDINLRDNYSNTPVHYALSYFDNKRNNGGASAVLTYLLEQNNLNITTKSNYGRNLLHDACTNIIGLPLDIFKLLIETKGVDVNAVDDYKHTPIHIILEHFGLSDYCAPVLTYLFCQGGINATIQGQNGITFLHIACMYINKLPLDVFKYLIETMGCDINAQANDKSTPLDLALQEFNLDYGGESAVLIYLLSQDNVNVCIQDPNGDTLLHRACSFHDDESEIQNAISETCWSHIVEFIIQKSLQQVFE